MKTSKIAIIVLLAIVSSCSSQFERTVTKFEGLWVLRSMTYENSLGEAISIDSLNIILCFTNQKDTAAGIYSTDRLGLQIINSDTIAFVYNFNISSSSFDINISKSDMAMIPKSALGAVQVYHFNEISKNRIEFYIDNEFAHLTNEILKNTSYIFEKSELSISDY